MLRSLAMVFFLGMGIGAMADEHARTVTVQGTGFAEIAPDRATLQMSIVAREPKLAAAQRRAADVTSRVLELTDRMSIDRDRVDTTGASVRADYRWNPKKEEQELRGYIAERRITVEIRDLEKLGALVEGAVSAGVNQVSPPQLDSSRRKETFRLALRAAAEDARANASELADALGARLDAVISINAGSSQPRPPMPYAAAMRTMAAESDAAESYSAAELTFNASVTVVFELAE